MEPTNRVLTVLAIGLLLLTPAGLVAGQDGNNSTQGNETNESQAPGNETGNQSAENGTSTNDTEENETSKQDPDEDGTSEDDQVEICHIPPGNPSARHTITVGAPAVEAHMRHGDHRGACEDGTETEQVQRARSQGEVEAEVPVGTDAEQEDHEEGDVIVRDISVERDDGLQLSFVVENVNEQTCRDGAVVMFDIDGDHFVAQGQVTETQDPGTPLSEQSLNESEENDTSTNGSEDNDTSVNESGNDSTTDNQSEDVNETEVEVSIETGTEVDAENIQVEQVHTVRDVVDGAEDGTVEYIVVQDEDSDVVHVMLSFSDLCEPQEASIVKTQSTGGALDGEAQVPGVGAALTALAVLATALAVASRRD